MTAFANLVQRTGAAATAAVDRLGRVRWPTEWSRPSMPRRLRLWLALAAAVGLVVAAGYQFWLRDSSLVRVEEVVVAGLTTKDAPRIEKALTAAASDMTTLRVRPEELERAVSAYPAVRSIEARTDFPHTLRIIVVERVAVALVLAPGEKAVPVAPDGTVLERSGRTRDLPRVAVSAPVARDELRDERALGFVAVAAGAPRPLRSDVARIGQRPGGDVVAELDEGPELVFGDASRVEAKWAAAASALRRSSVAGARYVDVRLPERPAVG